MSNRTRLPLGDYYQLLLRHGLLADAAPLTADLTHPVSLVSCDSKLVIPNTLFVCKGVKFKEEYLRSAMEQFFIFCNVNMLKFLQKKMRYEIAHFV